MRITVRPPDIEAEITFLPTEEGGRRSAAVSGYRPNHNFGLASLNDAAHEYIGRDSAAPGETVLANMWFLAPQYQVGRLVPGFTFTVQEGSRIVGHGVVRKVLNAELQRHGA
jgi:translation elongation factor EF-Tu-like GTPase